MDASVVASEGSNEAGAAHVIDVVLAIDKADTTVEVLVDSSKMLASHFAGSTEDKEVLEDDIRVVEVPSDHAELDVVTKAPEGHGPIVHEDEDLEDVIEALVDNMEVEDSIVLADSILKRARRRKLVGSKHRNIANVGIGTKHDRTPERNKSELLADPSKNRLGSYSDCPPLGNTSRLKDYEIEVGS